MNVKRFKDLCYIFSLIIIVSIVINSLMVIANYYIFYLHFSNNAIEVPVKFSNNISTQFIFQMTFGNNSATKTEELFASGFSSIGSDISILYAMIVLWYFFYNISLGNSPFREKYVRKIKFAGIAIMLGNMSKSLIFSIIISYIQPKGILFSFYITPFFFVGFAVYLCSQVVRYGVLLQDLSDNTV